MRFDVITLFPDLFAPHLEQGVTRRAFGSDRVDVRLWPLRDFALDAYRRVDDRPYGGGPGMLLLAEPLLRALAAVQADRAGVRGSEGADEGAPGAVDVPVVHFTPAGRRIDQGVVEQFAAGPGAVLVCGRYEGIDQRFIDRCVTHELSLGDFVLSGGELPALVLLDALARLQEGVLTALSHQQDSFSEAALGLIEGPQYSRPERLEIDGEIVGVPPVLLSGHHGEIARWRRRRSLEFTAQRRPDLVLAARAAGRLGQDDEAVLAALAHQGVNERDEPAPPRVP